jgi:hypothetical protein
MCGYPGVFSGLGNSSTRQLTGFQYGVTKTIYGVCVSIQDLICLLGSSWTNGACTILTAVALSAQSLANNYPYY